MRGLHGVQRPEHLHGPLRRPATHCRCALATRPATSTRRRLPHVDGGHRGADTSIVSGPTGTVSSADATFDFSSPETGVTYECGARRQHLRRLHRPGHLPRPRRWQPHVAGPCGRCRWQRRPDAPSPARGRWTPACPTPPSRWARRAPSTPTARRSTSPRNEMNVTYECRLDSAATFTVCTDPGHLLDARRGQPHAGGSCERRLRQRRTRHLRPARGRWTPPRPTPASRWARWAPSRRTWRRSTSTRPRAASRTSADRHRSERRRQRRRRRSRRQEPSYAQDSDGDGLINALDPDSDNDGLFDGTELGKDCSNAATNVGAHHCTPDADQGATVTDPAGPRHR
jgi:hypothetical protein